VDQFMLTQRRTPHPRRATAKPKTAARPKRTKVVKPAKPGRPIRPAKQAKPATPARHARPAKPAKSAAPARKAAAKPVRRTPALRAPERKTQAGRPRIKPAHGAAPEGPSSHDQAVGLFERGFQALQQRDFGRAGALLASVVNDFADEKELQERARVFLVICERQAAGREPRPRSFEERLNAATIAVNRGAFDEALALCRKLEGEDPNNDHVQYMLSVICTSLGNVPQALAHLHHAIDLAPENRIRAAQDPDLEPLRQDPGFTAVADALPRRRRTTGKKR
jgi:tetratricopeptide (TPR) repeat protein